MKQAICTLIEEDVRHALLLKKLETVGFNDLEHTSNVSESVFQLAGINECPFVDILCRTYFDLINAFNQSGSLELKPFAESVYLYLIAFAPSEHSVSESS